ncbi:MAG: peptide deformylase, partial [Synechococcaceae bacterium WB6_3B_236]|nr:peptide deformylase [Synechococcaceae bacterium WB6_3B_236]
MKKEGVLMGVRQILRMGDPQLRQRSMPVAVPWDDHLIELILDLQDTMEANQGA